VSYPVYKVEVGQFVSDWQPAPIPGVIPAGDRLFAMW